MYNLFPKRLDSVFIHMDFCLKTSRTFSGLKIFVSFQLSFMDFKYRSEMNFDKYLKWILIHIYAMPIDDTYYAWFWIICMIYVNEAFSVF